MQNCGNLLVLTYQIGTKLMRKNGMFIVVLHSIKSQNEATLKPSLTISIRVAYLYSNNFIWFPLCP